MSLPADDNDFDTDYDDTYENYEWEDDHEDRMSDAEADADTFRSAGWGMDEDYGCYGDY